MHWKEEPRKFSFVDSAVLQVVHLGLICPVRQLDLPIAAKRSA